MSTVATVAKGRFPDYSWIRATGKGNFLISPTVKRAAEEEVDAGAKSVVIDLEECPAMDSTFMGMLAGLARLLKERGCRKLQLAGLSDSTSSSLKTLGLTPMLDTEEPGHDWHGHEDEIRSELVEVDADTTVQKGSHVLEAHKTLIQAHSGNAEKFRDVIKMLEPQIKD